MTIGEGHLWVHLYFSSSFLCVLLKWLVRWEVSGRSAGTSRIYSKQHTVSLCCGPVSWGCRLCWLHLCRGVSTPAHECPGYNTKLHLMVRLLPWSSLLPGPLLVPIRVQPMCQKNCLIIHYTWNYLTVCKQMT